MCVCHCPHPLVPLPHICLCCLHLLVLLPLSPRQIVKAFLQHPNIDLHQSMVIRASKRINTPLLHAVDQNDSTYVKMLLDHPQIQLSDVNHPKRARTLAAYLLARHKASMQITDTMRAAFAVQWSPQTHCKLPLLLQSQIRCFLLVNRRRFGIAADDLTKVTCFAGPRPWVA